MLFLQSWLYPLRCCGLTPLSLDFLSVLKCESHIVPTVDGDEIYQPTPKGGIEESARLVSARVARKHTLHLNNLYNEVLLAFS